MRCLSKFFQSEQDGTSSTYTLCDSALAGGCVGRAEESPPVYRAWIVKVVCVGLNIFLNIRCVTDQFPSGFQTGLIDSGSKITILLLLWEGSMF